MSTFNLPDLGEGLQEAEIVNWHVAEGDHVTADEPLVSVETDKAVVDIPSPQAGYIGHLLAKPGDHVKVGAPLVEFEEGPHKDTGTVMGVLPEPPPKAAAPQAQTPVPAAPAVAPVPAAAPVAAAPSTVTKPNGAVGIVQAAPAARALARERTIDLSRVKGTGPNGLITRQDVEQYSSTAGAQAPAAAGEPLRGVQRAMAQSMSRARDAIAPATLYDHVDIEPWFASDHDVTSRLIRAIVAACAAVPVMNATYDDTANTLRQNPRVDLGIAVDTPDGLIVPVLRDAGGRDKASLRADVDALKTATRNRTIASEALRNPTLTLSNFGMMVGQHAALVIVPPQVAIIGAGRITLEAVPIPGGGVAFHHYLPLSLTFDHRVATGGDAARFMAALINSLQT